MIIPSGNQETLSMESVKTDLPEIVNTRMYNIHVF